MHTDRNSGPTALRCSRARFARNYFSPINKFFAIIHYYNKPSGDKVEKYQVHKFFLEHLEYSFAPLPYHFFVCLWGVKFCWFPKFETKQWLKKAPLTIKKFWNSCDAHNKFFLNEISWDATTKLFSKPTFIFPKFVFKTSDVLLCQIFF